jgi:hypothetical protein
LPGSQLTRRQAGARQGLDAPAKALASRPFTTGSAPPCERALAPCYGSDLLSLKSCFLCSRATPFLMPPESGGFRTLPGSFPPRRSVASNFREPFACFHCESGNLPARLARRVLLAVLVHSNDCSPFRSGHCVSFAGRNSPRILTSSARGFLFAAGDPCIREVAIPASCDAGRECKVTFALLHCFTGSQAHQLHLTFLRLPGVISGITSIAARMPPFCQRTKKRVTRRDGKVK